MRRAHLIFVCMAWLGGLLASPASAQAQSSASTPASSGGQLVDGVAARIEDDIITESEVRELGAFQQLVEGSAKPRTERIRELADQWIVHGEIATAKYPPPTSEDVDRAETQLAAQFPSPDEFNKRCVSAGLSDAAVRRMLAQQLYLSRFLDYRFRPAAQIDAKQIEAYYRDEFTPQLKARNQPVPALEDVDETIREVLVQRGISDRAAQWLDDTRGRLKIDVVSNGARP
jgi:hypothetical protein